MCATSVTKGAGVLDRVERGERVIVTRAGRAVAELRPLPRRSPGPAELIERGTRMPREDLTRCLAISMPCQAHRCASDAATRGPLDASTVIVLGRIDDPAALPDETVIGAIAADISGNVDRRHA